MRKKLLLLALAAAMLSACVLGMSACDLFGSKDPTDGPTDGHEHSFLYYGGTEPTCVKPGNIEYWYCSSCGKYFADEEGNEEISLEQTVLPADGEHSWGDWIVSNEGDCLHNGERYRECSECGEREIENFDGAHSPVYIEEREATCESEGFISHWQCSLCGKLFEDESCEKELQPQDVLLPVLEHDLTYVPARDATCIVEGNIEYWECAACGKFFNQYGEELADWQISTGKIAHSTTYVAAKPATCTEDGNVEHYFCSQCGFAYEDEYGYNKIDDPVLHAPGHKTVYHAPTAATCTQDGNIAYYECTVCHGLYSDEACTQSVEEVLVLAQGHSMEYVVRVEPTCTEAGVCAHWHCTVCEKDYYNSHGDIEMTETVLAPLGHELSRVVETPATCVAAGEKEHWTCERCGALFADEEGSEALSAADIVLPATGVHSYGEDHFCTVCGAADPAYAPEGNATAGLIYELSEDGTYAVLTGTEEEFSASDVVIASEYNGVPVAEIAAEAFKDNTAVRTVFVSDSVKKIGASAFAGCTLEAITLPFVGGGTAENGYLAYLFGGLSAQSGRSYVPSSLKSVTLTGGDSIADYAFYNCRSIEKVVLPEGLVSVGKYAFGNCEGLLGIDLPAGVTQMGEYAFYNCGNIRSFRVPEGVTELSRGLFMGCSRLKEVILPAGLTAVGEGAFMDCGALRAVELPASVEAIGARAFKNCDSLRTFEVPTGIAALEEGVFEGCGSLVGVSVPDSVTRIGENAFAGCASLTSIALPEGLILLSDGVFSSCKALVSVALPSTLEEIGEGAFAGCSSLRGIDIPASVSRIGARAFEKCTALEAIALGENVTEIGKGAFADCMSMGYIVLPFVGTRADAMENEAKLGYIFDEVIFEEGTVLERVEYRAVPSLRSVFVLGGTVGYEAFANNTQIMSVTLGDGVTRIEYGAFNGCHGLMRLIIGKNVTYIASEAFYSWPDKLSEIYNLSDVTLNLNYNGKEHVRITAESVLLIDEDGYVFTERNGEYVLLTYIGGESDLVLPDTFRGEGYGISAYAFYERGDIVSVQIGKGVTFIGNSAFYGCANLASVQIGAGVKDIESNAFAYSGVTQAIIPESVEYVRIGAFSFCADLATVSIGDGTRDIGYYAFANCKNLRSFSMGSGAENVDFSIIDESLENLESISVSADNPFYSGAGNCLVEKKSGTLFIGCKNTVIPDDGSVRAIRAQAFRNCTGLREIVIPDSVESIGANVFLYCDSLESLTVPFIGESRNGANTRLAYFFETDDVPSSLERLTLTDCDSIGSEAFRWCSSLREITLCGSIRTITGAPFSSCSDDLAVYFEGSLSDWMQIEFGGESSNPLSYAQKVYVGGELLAGNIVIPDEITVVKDFAFYNAKGIDSVTFHDGVTSIGRLAFYNCSFAELNLPADLVSLGQGAFRNCASLTEIVLLAGVTSLPAELFMSCTSLARVTAEGEILSVGSSAFYGCTALRELENVTENLSVVETSTFGNCVSLRDLAFSEKLRSIGNSAFSGCTSLVLTSLPVGLESIGNSAFSGCTSLVLGALPEGLKSIGDSAFYECSSLSLTALPAGLESIGEFAFSYCGSLVSLILPDSLESIARRAFYLTDIVRVEFDGDLASWLAVSIAEESYLLSNAKEFYIGGKLVDNLEIPEGVTDINARAFEEYDGLYSVVIPGGVVTIGECAFKNCSNLFRVVLGKDVSSIGSQAFSGCWLLYVVYDLSDHITVTAGSMADGYIGYSAKDVFTSIDDYGTNAWTDENGYILYDGAAGTILLGYTGDDAMLTLPESINGKDYTIAGGCFTENTSIVSVVIPAGVKSIGSSAFYGCTKLVSVRNLSELPISLGFNSSYGYVASYAKEVLSDADSASGVSRTDDGYLWYSDASNVYLLGYDGKLEGEITLPADFGGRAYSIYTSAFEGQIDLLGITVPEGVTGIGNNAFADCRNLKYISLPDSLIFVGKTAFVDTALQYSEYAGGKYLGNAANPYLVLVSFADGAATQATVHADAKLIAGGAFKSNRSVTDVALPAGLVSIGDEAFSECTALTRAEIGDSVVYIGDSAFYACSALTDLTIGAGVEQIGREAFWGTYALTEVRLYAEAFECGANCFRSAGADGEGLSLFIGANVTRIPDNFFWQNDSVVSKLVSVVFEEGSVCEYIGDSAFNGCEYLSELVLSESLKSIGDSAFLNCRSLTEVVLPDSLESIGTWVFYGCTSMASITLPFIGQNADGTGYAFFGHLFGANNATGVNGQASRIPDSLRIVILSDAVRAVPANAFSGCAGIESFTFGANVASIGKGAFDGCTSVSDIFFNSVSMADLTSETSLGSVGSEGGIVLTVGAGVERIPAYFFYVKTASSSKLQSVFFGQGSALEEIGEYAFYQCRTMSLFEMPEGVKEIGARAFYSCSSLAEIDLPEGLEIIGQSAFEGCAALTSIVIPETVTSLGADAFSFCTALTEIAFNAIACEDITLASSFYAAGNKSAGVTVTIGAKVTAVPRWLFYGSYGVNDENKITSIVFEEGSVCESIGSEAFALCVNLRQIVIPASVTSIALSAFNGCYGLESIVVESGNSVYHSAGNCLIETATKTLVAGCKNSVIPDDGSVTAIGDSAFMYNYSLTEIVIPDAVTKIGSFAFYWCHKLTCVTLGSGLNNNSIGSDAFNDCINLYSVINNSSIGLVPGNENYGRVAQYAKEVVSSQEQSRRTVTADGLIFFTTDDYDYLIGYVGNAEHLVLPDQFEGRNYLIGQYVFSDNKTLRSVVIGSGVTSIDAQAFSGCTNLESVVILGNSMDDLNVDAFRNCVSLESVVIPASVTRIWQYAFDGCDALGQVYYGGTAQQWGAIQFDTNNYDLQSAPRSYYSASDPGTSSGDSFWHFAEDGVTPILW